MRTQIDKIIKYFTEMETTSQKAVWIAFALFTIAGVVLAFGMLFLKFDQGELANFLRTLAGKPWAPLAVTAIFTLLAFLGAPQFVLIAATVAVFGASEGVILSWIATMVSAIVGYIMGRIGGSKVLKQFLGGRGTRLLNFIGNNGFLTSLIVRQVPTGPFILVNLALGASNVRASWFIAGTGLGIMPKILLVAFGAHGIGQVLKGENQNAIWFFIMAAAIWVFIVFVVRPLLVKKQSNENSQVNE
ncbi:MAG: TVP38/TMEM64 family protein [Caulobacterales bacterium]|nr:TVP38/TMEM64 family protein [Caulobacterales bacterium]